MAVPIVMVHGMWCSGQNLARLDALLSARTYECHRPTLPAHTAGPSQQQAVAAVSLREYADAVKQYISAQNFTQPPVLLGHSMGGIIAQIVAAEIPTAALVLLTPASPAGINALHPKVLPVGLPIFCRWAFWRRAHKLTPERARRYAVNALHLKHQDKLIDGLLFESGRAISEIAFWWADGRKTTHIDPALVQCPVYVVSAGRDFLTPAAVVKKVAAHYRNAALRHWPDRCHWVIDDPDTEDMVYEIDGWLRPILQKLHRSPTVLPRVSREP